MNAMLVYTASSCGVSASGIRLTAPTVPWMVSSSVSPVNTRIVSCFSCSVSVFHDGMSLDTGTFSGSQKLPVRRSQTSASLSSWRRFQLMAETRSISLMPSLTRTPFHLAFCATPRNRRRRPQHYNWCATSPRSTRCCVWRVASVNVDQVLLTRPPGEKPVASPGVTRYRRVREHPSRGGRRRPRRHQMTAPRRRPTGPAA